MSYLIKHISVVTPNYPSPREIERGVFVERLVYQWQAADKIVDVIAPVPVFNRARLQLIFGPSSKAPIAGDHVLYPRFLSVTSCKFGPIDCQKISKSNFELTAINAQKKLIVPDIFYGKFLLSGGAVVARLAKKYNRKAFVDLGESILTDKMTNKERASASDLLKEFTGIVCVSPRLVKEVLSLGVDRSRILLSPNKADSNRFFPMNRALCRQKLSLPQDAFIVIFVGHFVERKGPLRVLEVINKTDRNVKGVFVGRGSQIPIGERVIHAAPVPNDELPFWLNAANVMMLPTLAEGSCNAINEALACRLPVISSDIEDVRWQAKGDSVILVNPLNTDDLASALRNMIDRNIEYNRQASDVGLSERRGLDILNWMETRLEEVT